MDPIRTFKLIFLRAFSLFCPPIETINFDDSIAETGSKFVWLIMYLVLFTFAVVVSPFCLRKSPNVLSLFLITLMMLTIPCLITFGATRFRVSLIPFMALAGAVPISQLLDRYLPWEMSPKEKNESPSPPANE